MDADARLPLCHDPGAGLDHQPDTATWLDDDIDWFDEPEALLADDFEIPLPGGEAATPDAWSLPRHATAIAAGVFLSLSAAPAQAAPPSAAPSTAAPTEGPRPTPDSIWEGLVDRQVALSLGDGTTFRGTLLSINDGVLICARSTDGLVVFVDPGQVTAVHVEGLSKSDEAKKPPQTGQGMIVFGTIATIIGGALGVASITVGARCLASDPGYGCPYYSLPLGVASIVNLGVGIPFLGAGVAKRKRYRALTKGTEPKLSAFVAPAQGGVMGGVGLRF